MWVLEFIIYSKEEECVQYSTVQYSREAVAQEAVWCKTHMPIWVAQP
jgi:hypothetical protein